MTGVTYTGGDLPTDNYSIELDAQKVTGVDFFVGLTFPVHESHLSLILGGWGGVTCGLSSFNYQDAANNETTTLMNFEKNRWYHVKVTVQGDRIFAEVDGKMIVDTKIDGRTVHVRPEVDVSKPLGICSFDNQKPDAFRSF